MSSVTSTAFPQRAALPLKGKKILSIYYQHKPGGLCKRLYMMFEAVAAQGAELHYIAVAPYPIAHPRITPHILWTPFKKNSGLLFWCYFACVTPFYVFTIGRRERIDLVSVFGGVYGFFALFLKVLSQVPILTFVRADAREIGHILKRPRLLITLEDYIVSLAFKLSERIVAVSVPLKQTIVSRYGIDPEKVAVLENNMTGLSRSPKTQRQSRQKLGFGEDDLIILTMSVLDQRKNIDVLIKAAAYLKDPFVFLIVGEGPEKRRLEKLAERIQSDVKIIFTGWQEDVSDYLNAASFFILSSKHEGSPNALLEALSFGLPCLGSDLPEIRQVLKYEALIFDPIDAKALSDKIRRMMNPDDFEKIAALSEQSKKNLVFDWNQKITAIHQAVLFGEKPAGWVACVDA